MSDTTMIAKMIASHFEATPNNAPLTYSVSHHPPFECGTVGDLLSLIGKFERPHETMTSAPLDLDALEAAYQTVVDHRERDITPRNVRTILDAAPALIAMARKRDADVRHVLERQIGAEVLADENGRAATAAHAEIARLREALEAAANDLADATVSGNFDLVREACYKIRDSLANVRAVLAVSSAPGAAPPPTHSPDPDR